MWRDLTGMGLILLGMLVVLYCKNRDLQGSARFANDAAGPNQAYGALSMIEEGDAEAELEMLEVDELQSDRGKQAAEVDPFDTSMCLVSKMRVERAMSLRSSSSNVSLLGVSVVTEEASSKGSQGPRSSSLESSGSSSSCSD